MICEDLFNVRAITPSANVLDPRPRAIYASTSGNDDGTSATIAVVAGTLLRGLRPWKIPAATATVFACD